MGALCPLLKSGPRDRGKPNHIHGMSNRPSEQLVYTAHTLRNSGTVEKGPWSRQHNTSPPPKHVTARTKTQKAHQRSAGRRGHW